MLIGASVIAIICSSASKSPISSFVSSYQQHRPRFLSRRPLVSVFTSVFPGNLVGRFARASSSRLHLTTPVNYSYLLAPNSQLRGLQYNKPNTLIWAQHIERWLYQRLWRKMKTGTTMLIGVKSKKGSLFSMRLRDAINIQLIFPPKVLLFHCLLTFASLIGGRSCYSVSLSSTDFPLRALQIRQGCYFCFVFVFFLPQTVSDDGCVAVSLVVHTSAEILENN